jgi:hypothetical protein
VLNLIKQISQTNHVVVIIEDRYKDFYKELKDQNNITIDTAPTLESIFSIASNCSCFLGIDSGIRYIPYHFSKPTFVFSKYCQQYGQIIPSHLIRWLIFAKNVFPVDLSADIVCSVINNCIRKPAYSLYPEILSTDIDEIIVKRKYDSTY